MKVFARSGLPRRGPDAVRPLGRVTALLWSQADASPARDLFGTVNVRCSPAEPGQTLAMSSFPSAYRWRSAFLSNLPTLVLGSAGISVQCSGTCHLASRSAR